MPDTKCCSSLSYYYLIKCAPPFVVPVYLLFDVMPSRLITNLIYKRIKLCFSRIGHDRIKKNNGFFLKISIFFYFVSSSVVRVFVKQIRYRFKNQKLSIEFDTLSQIIQTVSSQVRTREKDWIDYCNEWSENWLKKWVKTRERERERVQNFPKPINLWSCDKKVV